MSRQNNMRAVQMERKPNKYCPSHIIYVITEWQIKIKSCHFLPFRMAKTQRSDGRDIGSDVKQKKQ